MKVAEPFIALQTPMVDVGVLVMSLGQEKTVKYFLRFWLHIFKTCKNENVIIFMRSHRREEGRSIFYPAFIFMFDGYGNLIEDTGVLELTDMWNYREQLREFKEVNGWSFYFE